MSDHSVGLAQSHHREELREVRDLSEVAQLLRSSLVPFETVALEVASELEVDPIHRR